MSRRFEEHSAAMAAGGLKPMLPVSCDVTDELAVVALFEQVRLKCGPCNLLVNCAGIQDQGQRWT